MNMHNHDTYLDRHDPANGDDGYDRDARVGMATLELIATYTEHADELFAVLDDSAAAEAGRLYGLLARRWAAEDAYTALNDIIEEAAMAETEKQVSDEDERADDVEVAA